MVGFLQTLNGKPRFPKKYDPFSEIVQQITLSKFHSWDITGTFSISPNFHLVYPLNIYTIHNTKYYLYLRLNTSWILRNLMYFV